MYTESDMKVFFQNIIDQVSTLSTQAARVEGLEQRINELSESIQRLRDDNRSLEASLAQAHDKVNALGRDLEQTTQELSNERAVTQNLREVLVSRDSKVQELEHNNQVERDAHKVTLSERDDARRRGEELDREVQSFREKLEHTEADLQGWRDRAYKAEAEAADYKQQLDKINSLLNPHVPSRDFQVVG